MPFIVDSLRMALSRNSLYVDQLHNVVLRVVRDGAGRMDAQALSAHGEDSGTHHDQDGTSEAILLFQLELITSETMLTSLHDDLSEMLYELSIIVNDFKSVVEITHESRSELAALIRTQSIADTTMLQESVDFLDWLLADHYIFLGLKSIGLNLLKVR